MLVKIVSETGWQTRATGLYPGTAIGATLSRCGFPAILKKYGLSLPFRRIEFMSSADYRSWFCRGT